MKYISLIRLMLLYGSFVDSQKRVPELRWTQRYSQGDDNGFTVFSIITSTDNETGQVMKQISAANNKDDRERLEYGDFYIDDDCILPPVLETEWLKKQFNMTDDQYEVMQQLSYMLIMNVVQWRTVRHVRGTRSLFDYLCSENVIMDVEELEDTPVILSKIERYPIHYPKIRSWKDVLLYGVDFRQLYEKCNNQSSSFREIYAHLPLLMSLFMVDYYGTKLEDWDKSSRLYWENTTQDYVNELSKRIVLSRRPEYTYGRSTNITQYDLSFVHFVFSLVYDLIHELNTNIGRISYFNYKNIHGPEKIQATLCLDNMRINWNKEIERAEREKKEAQKELEEAVSMREGQL